MPSTTLLQIASSLLSAQTPHRLLVALRRACVALTTVHHIRPCVPRDYTLNRVKHDVSYPLSQRYVNIFTSVSTLSTKDPASHIYARQVHYELKCLRSHLASYHPNP